MPVESLTSAGKVLSSPVSNVSVVAGRVRRDSGMQERKSSGRGRAPGGPPVGPRWATAFRELFAFSWPLWLPWPRQDCGHVAACADASYGDHFCGYQLRVSDRTLGRTGGRPYVNRVADGSQLRVNQCIASRTANTRPNWHYVDHINRKQPIYVTCRSGSKK